LTSIILFAYLEKNNNNTNLRYNVINVKSNEHSIHTFGSNKNNVQLSFKLKNVSNPFVKKLEGYFGGHAMAAKFRFCFSLIFNYIAIPNPIKY
jgi:hypothetical protein